MTTPEDQTSIHTVMREQEYIETLARAFQDLQYKRDLGDTLTLAEQADYNWLTTEIIRVGHEVYYGGPEKSPDDL